MCIRPVERRTEMECRSSACPGTVQIPVHHSVSSFAGLAFGAEIRGRIFSDGGGAACTLMVAGRNGRTDQLRPDACGRYTGDGLAHAEYARHDRGSWRAGAACHSTGGDLSHLVRMENFADAVGRVCAGGCVRVTGEPSRPRV